MPRKAANSFIPVKKTGQQNQRLSNEDKFISVTQTPLIKLQLQKLTAKFHHISRALCRFQLMRSQAPPSEQVMLEKYIQYYYEYFEFDQFDPEFTTLPSLDVSLYTVSNQEQIYKSYNIFHNLPWAVRFNNKFVGKICSYKIHQIKYVLAFIYLLAQGNFYGRKTGKAEYGYVTSLSTKSIPYNRFFYLKLFRQKNMLFSVGVEKVPIIKNNVIKRYQYASYIYILDILTDSIVQNPQKLNENLNRYIEILKEDVSKRDHGQELVIDEKCKKDRNNKKKIIRNNNSEPQGEYLFQEIQNPYRGLNEIFQTQLSPDLDYKILPLLFKPYYVSMGDTSSLIFNRTLKRWVTSDYLSSIQQKALNQYQRKVNEQIIKRFVDFQSAKTLVELLTKIPNFRVELTEQEKDVIGQNGNVLVIGRSGTGKTTCAVLRLFAIQMLFKIRLSLSKKKHKQQLKDTRCSADDIDKTLGLHCIFVTASPVLTNQIERYYKKLTDNIKLQLQKKKKRVEQQRKKEQQQSMKKKKEVLEENADNQQQIQQIKQNEEIQQQIKQKGQQSLEVPQKLQIKKSQQVLEEEQQMNKQLGGLKLQQKIQNEKFEEDEENFDQMKDQLQEKMKKFRSLHDLRQEDYPGFFTVKSFIMMIDGTLEKPFFIRKNEQNQAQSQATWHNEKKGVMMIENYYKSTQQAQLEKINQEQIEQEINYSDQQQLQHEYLRQIQLRENKQKQQLTAKLKKTKIALSFEVDYDYFQTYFWPNVKHRHYSARNITPHLVWTEIFSTIKGSANAHLYPGFNLNEKAYIAQSSNAFLSKEEKLDVFQTYCQYQRWKINNGGYDMMDAVNYILNFIRFRGYNGPDVHYIMIDQVQDLPHSIVYLLSKTVKYGVFYSGDTAQTIAKGVGFRFCDLKNLFDPKQFDSFLSLNKPVVKQLTVNFRSHNNILQLANSVVSSIEILFPKTIDRLKKQVSNLSGPKPMILAEKDEELLFYVLCGDEGYKRDGQENQETNLKKPPLQFGCDQVIIVRDQESKAKIPTMLQHALCLTIYEAKGLQFNDVILFNFFSDSKCADKWNLLKFLKIGITEMDVQDYERSITKHTKQVEKKQKMQQQKQKEQKQQKQNEVEQAEVDVECIVDRTQNNKIQIKKIISDAKIVMKDINDYAELCSQLKMLYTAITRPKNTLIIYDEDSTSRKSIEKIWEKLEVVEMVSKQLVEESGKKNKPQSKQLRIFKSIVNSTDKNQWKKQGMKMYARGYFEQAMKCFTKSGNQQLYKKAEANHFADLATKKLIQIESQKSAIANKLIQYQKMSESDLAKLKKKLKKEEAGVFTQFQEAGKIFQNLLMFKQAGQCYFSGRKYQKAYENFSKAFMNKQAGQSLQMLNKYRQAADCYQKQGLYLKVIECLDMINQWQLILKVIQKFSLQMTELQKKSLFKKYSALALQQLVYQIQFENQPEQNKPQNNRVQIIKEQEDDEEEDWDSSEDPQVAAERIYRKRSQDSSLVASRKESSMSNDNEQNIMKKNTTNDNEPKRKQSQIEEDKVIKQSVYENIQTQKQEKKDIKPNEQQKINDTSKADQSSFCDLNQSKQQKGQKQKQTQVKIEQKEDKKDNLIQSIYEKPNEPQPDEPLTKEKQASQPQADLNRSSFADLNESESSFADLNSEHSQLNTKYPSELQPDIESIKSMADPEDIWLQSALSQIPAKTNTEYSIIDEDQNYNSNVRIIKTKGNIVVQDQIMRKIVAIVAIVSQGVDEFFKQFKGYQSLISVNKDSNNQQIIDNRPEISEFEDVDPKFINIILDTLQSFKLYKLCLFVCNRYHMPHKAGRYLISMALKYSTNSQINNTLNPALIAPSISRKLQLEKGILASIALHAMFQNVSPDFLKIKVQQIVGLGTGKKQKQESKNSLGAYFIQGLILQGLYKKAVFMVNPEESLNILRNFCDTGLFQQIFNQKILKKPVDSNKTGEIASVCQFLPYVPKSPQQQQYTICKLEQLLTQHNIINKLEMISQRFYKEFNVSEIKVKYENGRKDVKDYAKFLAPLFKMEPNSHEELIAVIESNITSAIKIFENGTNLQIYDLVSFLVTAINHEPTRSAIFSLKPSTFCKLFYCLHKIRLVLHKKHLPLSFPIIQAVLSVYCCRMLSPCKSTKFINDGYALVNRTSTICNQFVQQLKKNKDQTAYFFEQDYNFILVKSNKLIQVVSKKFDYAYNKFLRARVQNQMKWMEELRNKFMHSDYKQYQSEHLLKALIRQQLRILNPKQRKAKKQSSTLSKKLSRPKFSYKHQGRPELAMDLLQQQSDSDPEGNQVVSKDNKVHNLFTFPDLSAGFKYFSHLAISAFYNRLETQQNQGKSKFVSGRLLYGAGINDSYKQYLKRRQGSNLYDGIQFRKFYRLDLYADNLASIIRQLSYTQRHMFSAELIIILMIQYKILINGKDFKLELPRRFLKFLPNLTLLQVLSNPPVQVGNNEGKIPQIINEYLHPKKHVCIFSYKNLYSSELQEKEVVELICDFLDVLKREQNFKCFNMQKFVMLLTINMPINEDIYEAIRQLIQIFGYQWDNVALSKLRGASNFKQFLTKREKLMADKQLMSNSQLWHEVRVTDVSDLDKNINQSQIDYEINEKITQARIKSVNKISVWWRSLKSKTARPSDQKQILSQNRLIKMTYNIKHLPLDDRFLLRSSQIRDVLVSFYLRNVVTSSLDFHFILMTLNKIEELRREYIKAYSSGLVQMKEEGEEVDFEKEITEIQGQIQTWKNDSKWLKDRNIDLKKKKVFEIKWMTKNTMHKIVKKRAGLHKQKRLQIKKKMIKNKL